MGNAKFSSLLFEFLKVTAIALLWLICAAIVMGGFGDYQPTTSIVHANEVRR